MTSWNVGIGHNRSVNGKAYLTTVGVPRKDQVGVKAGEVVEDAAVWGVGNAYSQRGGFPPVSVGSSWPVTLDVRVIDSDQRNCLV